MPDCERQIKVYVVGAFGCHIKLLKIMTCNKLLHNRDKGGTLEALGPLSPFPTPYFSRPKLVGPMCRDISFQEGKQVERKPERASITNLFALDRTVGYTS